MEQDIDVQELKQAEGTIVALRLVDDNDIVVGRERSYFLVENYGGPVNRIIPFGPASFLVFYDDGLRSLVPMREVREIIFEGVEDVDTTTSLEDSPTA